MSAAKIGRKYSDEHRAKMSVAKSGDNNPMYGKPSPISNPKWQRTCIHCSKTMNKANYTHWHGDKCKQNKLGG